MALPSSPTAVSATTCEVVGTPSTIPSSSTARPHAVPVFIVAPNGRVAAGYYVGVMPVLHAIPPSGSRTRAEATPSTLGIAASTTVGRRRPAITLGTRVRASGGGSSTIMEVVLVASFPRRATVADFPCLRVIGVARSGDARSTTPAAVVRIAASAV